MLVQGKQSLQRLGYMPADLAGFQGALMVPTEILAEQHADSLVLAFEPMGCKCGLINKFS